MVATSTATKGGDASSEQGTVHVKSNGTTAASSFGYQCVPIIPAQTKPIQQVRIPRFDNVEDERKFRKLHHAAALRWLGANGYNNEGAGGHMTVRDPEFPDHFWINPHAKSLSRMTPDDLCLVNDQGAVVGGNMHAINPAGFSIHSAVHKARPEVIAAVHCHSVPSKAFASFGKPIDMITQDACRFYNAHSVYQGFGGSALAKSEGENIANALGPTNKAVILQNHGILAVSKTPDGAAFNFGALDRCIQSQLLADAAGKNRGWETIKIGAEEAEFTRKVYKDELEYITFQPAFEDIVYQSNGELSMTSGGERYPAWNEV